MRNGGGGGDYVCPREDDIITLVRNSKHLISTTRFDFFLEISFSKWGISLSKLKVM